MKKTVAAPGYGIVIHGGAGSFVPGPQGEVSKRRRVLKESVESGYSMLNRGKSASDAIESAIKVMEDSLVFNAGGGSSLTLEGKISADAAIMNGDLSCGAIGDANCVKNPISLARAVMERSDHVLIVGSENLSKFARAIGMPLQELAPSAQRSSQYKKNISQMKKDGTWPRNFGLVKKYLPGNLSSSDTVGAVAIDMEGRVCAGVSTGGRWLKLPGRVGDSALIGAGIYADNSSGAACATGAGEDIIRIVLCKSVCDYMKMGASAQSACDAAIDSLTSSIGPGVAGVIAVDKSGRFGTARNTEMMTRAFHFDLMKSAHVAVLPEEKDPRQQILQNSRKRLTF